MRPCPLYLTVLFLVSAAGCSTHESKYEQDAPPRPADTGELTSAANRLVSAPQDDLASLSPEALASLTQAAAAQFKATGAPGMRDLAKRYGTALLGAKLTTEQGVGFYSAARPLVVDREFTLRAGLALADAYEITADPAMRSTIVQLTDTVTSPQFGWEAYKGGAGVTDGTQRGPSISVANTALAAAFLSRAATVADTPTRNLAVEALRSLDRGQAAVGRWYSHLPSGTPMNLRQWATTLRSLELMDNRLAQGILGGGVPGLYDGVFESKGRLAKNPLTRDDHTGVALSYAVLAGYGDRRLSTPAIVAVMKDLREDGTVRQAPQRDIESQALYATAMAVEVATTNGRN